MKIKASKLFAAALAVVLVFSSLAVAVSAANADPYVKVSSISNVALGSKSQELTVSLSPDSVLTDAQLTLSYTAGAIDKVSVSASENVVGGSVSVVDGQITLNVTKAENTDANNDMLLCTVKFDFVAAGLVELTASTGADGALNDKLFGASLVIGEELESVYTDMNGIGLKNYLASAGIKAPKVDAKVKIELVPFEGSEMAAVAPIEIAVEDAVTGNAVMTASELEAFLDKNAAEITKAVQAVAGNEELSYADFAVKSGSIMLNGEALKADKYVKDTDYVYTVTMNQLKKTSATIEVVFRPAMKNQELYHSSNIPSYKITLSANAGAKIYSQATILTYIKEYVELYNTLNGDLDHDNDGVDDITIDGILMNQHIKDNSNGQYDLGDFVLDESVVTFDGSAIEGDETFSSNADENVYAVYFDQVNVPATVLGAAAEAFGKLNYAQFAKANVIAINEAIDSFQAFCDSLVNAEWPCAKDVEEEKDDSDSPDTGSMVGLGSTLVISLGLAAAAAIVLKKKED